MAMSRVDVYIGFDVTSTLSFIRTPTLVVHGEEDAIIPLAEGGE